MNICVPFALWVVTCVAVSAQEGLGPLHHPRAPRALRGLTVIVDPRPGGDEASALRAAQYLARVLEGSGAGVALTRTGFSIAPSVDASELAERAGAGLVVLVSGEVGDGAPVAVSSRRTPARTASLEEALAACLRSSFAECDRAKLDVESTRPTLLLRPLCVPGGADGAPLRRHRPAVHSLFEAIAQWAAAERRALDELPAGRGAERMDGPPSGVPFWPVDRAPRTEEEVAGLLAGWRRGYGMDPTQVWLEVEVRRSDDEWVLSGSTELPSLERALRRLLASHGVKPLRGALRSLPNPELGADPYGLATGAAALTWAVPGSATGLRSLDGSGQVEETELQVGEPVRLLDRRDGHFLVHALSGYLGWVPEGAVEPCTETEHAAAVDRSTGPAERGALVAEAALAKLGVPYVFGGRSSTGIDCSGLCRTAWEEQGVFLPRDARMQILVGALVSTHGRPAPLRPGDLLFFSNASGRISHVGVSLGGSRFVHATPPEVTVESLDPQDPWYGAYAERFVAAKRPAR